MKKILLSFSVIIWLTALSAAQEKRDGAWPTLGGDKAIEQLKRNGQYDSLAEAVRQIRQGNEQSAEGVQSSIGQSTKLIASFFENSAIDVKIYTSGSSFYFRVKKMRPRFRLKTCSLGASQWSVESWRRTRFRPSSPP